MSDIRHAPLPQRLKFAAKSGVAHLLHVTGVLGMLVRRELRGRAVVLTYHRVLSREGRAHTWSHPAIVVARETFEQHMKVLQRYFTIQSLDTFAAHVREGRPFPTAACLVTFDDGWLDTYTEAFPILERMAIPATVFLPVGFIGSQDMFWQERLGHRLHAVWERAARDAAFRDRARPVLAAHGLADALKVAMPGARLAIRDLVQRRKKEHHDSAPAAIAAVTELLGPGAASDDSPDAFVTWDQVRDMAGRGVSFGGHSVTHRILPSLPASEVEREVSGTRAVLDRELPYTATAFSYPNGDWSPAVADAVKAGGFDLAFSTQRGSVDARDPATALKRINIHEDVTSSVPMFLARLAGVF